MRTIRLSLTALCISLFTLSIGSSHAQAQGPDCANAAPIVGLGQFPLISVGGDSGAPPTPCIFTCPIDSWYEWTAPSDGSFWFDVNGDSGYQAIELYEGAGCAATYLGCSGSTHHFSYSYFLHGASAGQQYMLRGKCYGSSASVDIRYLGAPCTPGQEDRFAPNSTCEEAAPIGNGTYLGLVHNLTAGFRDVYSVCLADGDTVTVTASGDDFPNEAPLTLHAFKQNPNTPGECQALDYLAGYSGYSPSISVTNTTGADHLVYLFINHYYPDYQSPWLCHPYSLEVQGANGCGGVSSWSTFCDPMEPNSSGLPLELSAVPGSGVHSGVRLEANQGPPNQFASLIVGTGTAEPGVMLGNGRFCLSQAPGAVFGRYNLLGTDMGSIGIFDGDGVFENLSGTSATTLGFDVPLSLPNIGGNIQAGQTWHFQMWTRDGPGQSNWSNGVSVDFLNLP